MNFKKSSLLDKISKSYINFMKKIGLKEIASKLEKEQELKSLLVIAHEDGQYTEEEFHQIESFRKEHNLSSEIISKYRSTNYSDAINPILTKIYNSRRLSPNDLHEIHDICERLLMPFEIPNEFEIFKKLWIYDQEGNLDLEVISVDINMKKGEECYHRCSSSWSQKKLIKERQGYTGLGVSMKIAKGLYLRTGRSMPIYKEYEGLLKVSDGELYITNKRLVFLGNIKSTNITFNRIINVESFSNGILLHKTSGNPDFFELDEAQAEYCSLVLEHLL